ncbi:MAG: RpiB/LacA/LacB family sugar-phosphate isomerase [Kiritimatiellia bacterium]
MKKLVAGVAMAAACACGAAQKETILVAADPFAVELKNVVVRHLEKRGFEVKDYGATAANKEKPYFDSAVDVCRAMQKGEAKRAFLFCGTGMGMGMVANRFKGVRAAVVESVFAARMCRSINDANVLCMGQMIWGNQMAIAAADAFLDTAFTQGLEDLAPFLKDAAKKVDAIDGK